MYVFVITSKALVDLDVLCDLICFWSIQFSSVAESCPTLCYSMVLAQQLVFPSPTPGACSNSSPSSWWCDPTILSSVVPFSSWLQSFPASGSFPVNQFFTSGVQSIGVSASASVLPMNIQDWFPLGVTGWISLLFKGVCPESSPTPQFKSIHSSVLSLNYGPNLISIDD